MGDLVARYHHRISELGFAPDDAQVAALGALSVLCQTEAARPRRGLSRLLPGARRTAPERPVGFYLYGGVGRGKTFVIDLCHEHLPAGAKWRIHFHSFMQWVHGELRAAGEVRDPLKRVGRAVAERANVLFLDEFHVTDITDAMLLAGLLEILAAEGVVLVTTSNDVPESLYPGGLQRERFIPAISFIRARFALLPFDGEMDYRLRQLTAAPVYHVVADNPADADGALAAIFERLSAGSPIAEGVAESEGEHGVQGVSLHADHPEALEVDGRRLPARRVGPHLAWFEFPALCDGPRSARDYIELARRFETVMVSGIPIFTSQTDDAARRFMTMVDEFYDRGVKLIVSAAAEPADLYRGERLAQGFARTVSRLVEMRSHDYLHRPHLS